MFKASAGQVDLNPPIGSWMTGFAARIEPTIGVHDPILARAILLDDGETKLAIVCCDLIGFHAADVARMRQRIAAQSSIPAAHVLIACTHTHSGPASMPLRGVMGYVDAEWLAEAQSRIVNLVAGLSVGLRPAQFACGTTLLSGIGYNRQDQTHRTDEQLSVVAIESTEGGAIATLVNYGTHPVVLGPTNLLFSADYAGEVARQLARLRGGVGLYLQGTCGDVDPVVYRDRGWGTGTFDDTRALGERLADAAITVLKAAPRTHDVQLRVGSKVLDIPLDPPPEPAQLDRLIAEFEADRQKALSAEPHDRMNELIAVAMLEWANQLRQAVQASTLRKSIPAELFIAAINDVRIVGLPFETYSDIGLAIKRNLQPLRVMFAGYANGLYGYCPARWAKDQGGYGPDSSARWFPELLTPVGYGADDLIITEATTLAH